MIETVHLFPILDQRLIDLLKSLSQDDWNRPTLAGRWRVKDVAAHLLDGNVRSLSGARDGHLPPPDRPVGSYAELVQYLNELNAEWVRAARRLSPAVLIDWLEATGKQYAGYLATLPPYADAIFPVAWAGESVSPNWFHIAREYTEKFHHQQQIREATGKPGIMKRELFFPFIDTFMRGLPHAYRTVTPPDGTAIRITVTSDIGGDWYLLRKEGAWGVSKDSLTPVACQVRIPPDVAWKLFTKGVTPDQAREQVQVYGQRELGEAVLTMVAVMA